MVWVRIDDHFDEHPKVAALSDSALALFVTGLAYCNRNLTDGFIPSSVGIGKLRYCDGNAAAVIRELEEAGIWEKTEGGWQIHDYTDFQPTKETVLAERESKRRAGQAGGLAAARARATANGKQKPSNRSSKTQAGHVAESKPVPDPVPSNSPSVSPPPPKSKQVTDELLEELSRKHPRFDVHRELEKFHNYNTQVGRKLKSEAAGFRNWMLTAEEKFPPPSNNGHQNGKTSLEFQMPENTDCEFCNGGPLVACETHGKPSREPLTRRT